MSQSRTMSLGSGQGRVLRGRHYAVAGAMLMAAMSLAACARSGGGGGATVTGNISVNQPAGTPIAVVAQDFANAVKKDTGGKVVLKVFPDDQLGSGASIVQGCQQGTIAFCQEQALSAVVPSIQVPQAPYLFTSIDNASQVLNSAALSKEYATEFKAKGLVYLGQWALPPSAIGTVSKPVKNPADFKGLRLRVPNALIGGLMFKPTGADPIQMDANQVTTSLSTHAIDGVDDPLPTLLSQRWIDEMHYLTISNDWYGADTLAASSNFMARLSASERSAVQRDFTASLAENNKLESAQLQQAMAKVKSMGVQIINPSSVEPFKKAFSSVNPALVKQFPDVMPLVLKATEQG